MSAPTELTVEPDDEQVRETYAHFGLAVYLAQVLEHAIVNAVLVLRLPKRDKLTRHDIDAFMSRQFENTLGRLIGNLQNEIRLPDDLETVLKKALRTRNWLCHDYFRERAPDFVTRAGCKRMIAELQSAQALLARADKALAAVVRPLRERFGVSEETVRAEYESLMRELGR